MPITGSCTVILADADGIGLKDIKLQLPIKDIQSLKNSIGFTEIIKPKLDEIPGTTPNDFMIQVMKKNKWKTIEKDKHLLLVLPGVKICVQKRDLKPAKRGSIMQTYRRSLNVFAEKFSADKERESAREANRGSSIDPPSSPIPFTSASSYDALSRGRTPPNQAKPYNVRASLSLPTSPVLASPSQTFRKGSVKQPVVKKGLVFGIDLEEAIAQQGSGTIPKIVRECITWLREKEANKEEGIFRISGPVSEIEELRREYDRKGTHNLNEKDYNVHSITGILKTYFRELPMPVIIYRYYSTALKVGENSSIEQQKSHLKIILSKLPPEHRDVILFVCQFLSEVAANHETNKMHIHNIALIWGPNFLRNFPEKCTPMSQLNDAESVNNLTAVLIEHSKFFMDEIGMTEGRVEEARKQAKREWENDMQADIKSRRERLLIRKSSLAAIEQMDREAMVQSLQARFPEPCVVEAKFDVVAGSTRVGELEELSVRKGQELNFLKIITSDDHLWLHVIASDSKAGIVLPGQVIVKTVSTLNVTQPSIIGASRGKSSRTNSGSNSPSTARRNYAADFAARNSYSSSSGNLPIARLGSARGIEVPKREGESGGSPKEGSRVPRMSSSEDDIVIAPPVVEEDTKEKMLLQEAANLQLEEREIRISAPEGEVPGIDAEIATLKSQLGEASVKEGRKGEE
ncbi:hypothetical protein PROFUN_01771 [Planoprotostelium fungivorum]|uniref:Rho-GAP domain-containing protein n=1 Tax=Planoprotostelium fungivorum TaxID=1890364 RepID=A0A2P6MWH7_9EUKA|nr:hypothetical protein PROFUN_01771 [Planoprotostelium fungivorum]